MDLEALYARATRREALPGSDGKSGARLERLVVDGDALVVKHLHPDDDWVMRASGDVRCRPWVLWRTGLEHRLPAVVDTAVVGVAEARGRNGWGVALVLRDVHELLVPEGDHRITEEQEARFLDHMAALHHAFWGWEDDCGLMPLANRYTLFTPLLSELEAARGTVVPRIVGEGWRSCEAMAPELVAVRAEPWALIDALAALPATLLHGDWKLGNLGSHPDGRTILLDWALPGPGPGVADLAWWLAVNTRRLPTAKESNIAVYRAGLERRGVATSPWWDRAVDLALLGAFVQFGWEKALDPGPELDWWVDRARAGLAHL